MQVWLLDIDKFVAINGLNPVTNSVSFERGMIPTEDGLFSTKLFGMSVTERKATYAYIDLKKHFLNPKVYITLKSLNRNFEHLIYGTKNFRIEDGMLVVDPAGDTGIDFLYKNWDKINFKKNDSNKRNVRITMLENNKKNVIFMTKWIVIPAFYRDVNLQSTAGRTKIPEINDRYNQIIRNVGMMESANNFDFMMHSIEGKIQDLMVEIYNMLKSKIEKKNGYMRKSVLAKSVDYCVRTTITATPYHANSYKEQNINFLHTGVPLGQCCTLFTPFILGWLRRYFKGRLEDNANQFPVKLGTGETVYVKLDNPGTFYNDEYLEKQLERWIENPSSRYSKIEVPIKKEYVEQYKLEPVYLSLVGYNTADTTMQKDENRVERPLTWTDVLYMACVDTTSDKHVVVTRYPMLDYLGTFISRIEVMSTRHTTPMIINDHLYKNYPTIQVGKTGNLDSDFIDSLKFSATYLSGLDGDFDGDQVTAKGIFSQEANEEAERIIFSKTNLITINGGIIRTIGNEAIQTLFTMTRFREKTKSA